MIEWLSTWAEQIIVAVVIATIIEMILPNSNNKKYIKSVIGVYILFTIISPIIGKVTNINLNNLNYNKYFEEINSQETLSRNLANYNDKSVEEIYINNLKQDMKSKLKEKGYMVSKIDLKIQTNEDSYGILEGILLIAYKEDIKNDNTTRGITSISKIENVKIGNTIQNDENSKKQIKLTDSEENEIKEYLANVYDIKKENIKINC